jgi:hypothetical protein
MTDRHAGYIVALAEDIREDDAQFIITAISMIKGVLEVQPVVAGPMDSITRLRVRREILKKMYEAFDNA